LRENQRANSDEQRFHGSRLLRKRAAGQGDARFDSVETRDAAFQAGWKM